ncbi:MAG: hypothetical protein ACWGMZ_01525 [Thermoguttaceae bacterium]
MSWFNQTVQITIYGRWRGSPAAVAWAIAILVVAAVPEVTAEPNVSEILARVQLLPLKDDPRLLQLQLGSRAGQSQSADVSPEERARADAWIEARSARFAEWVRHEDEFLSFRMPDDPRIRLEIKTPEDRIPVAGGPIRSEGISFFRCYRLTFKGETYCLLLLDRQSKFDDSVCFCGHVAYEKYLQHHGALYRFSLLENGRVKKIQVLGEGMRLVLFEWTHMPIHPEVYAQIALSVRWRHPPRDLKALTAKVQQEYGKAGFLEMGMDRAAVVALLGPPTSEDHGLLRYVFRRSNDKPPGSEIEEVTWQIPLTDGKLVNLSPDWRQDRKLPPERNSVQWVLAKLDSRQGESDSVDPARQEELRPLLSRVIDYLPKAHEGHWWMLCRAAHLLAQRDVKDARVPEIIKKRYLDPQLSARDASEILHEYEPKENQALFVKRIRLEMSLACKPDAIKEQADLGYNRFPLKQLLGYVRSNCDERNAIILEAIKHPHAGIRMDGYSYSADLPKSVARPRLQKGLGDSSAEVRAYCAGALVELSASSDAENPEDLALLRAQLAKEKDERVIEALREAIKQLE